MRHLRCSIMLEAFIIILSGCADDGSACIPVQTYDIAAVSFEACERQLDGALSRATADYPVFLAECRSADQAPTELAGTPLKIQ